MSAHQGIPRSEWAARYIAGTKSRDIAAAAGVEQSTVLRHLRALDIPRDHKRGPPKVRALPQNSKSDLQNAYAAKVERFIELAQAGRSVGQAAAEMGVKYDVAQGYAKHACAQRPELADMLRKAGKAYQVALNCAAKAERRASLWPELKEMRERGASFDECAHALDKSVHMLRRLENENGGKPKQIQRRQILTKGTMSLHQAAAVSGHITRLERKPTTQRQCLASSYDGFRCTTVFASEGPHHRLCGECRGRS